MSFRALIIDEYGNIHKIPCSKFEKAIYGQTAFHQFANQTVKLAIFYGESENRRFSTIYRDEFSIWKFDKNGYQDQEFFRESLSMLAQCFHVFPLTEFEAQRLKFKKKKHSDRHRWFPDPEEKRQLMNLVLFT